MNRSVQFRMTWSPTPLILMLEQVEDELPTIAEAILYSITQLPEGRERRLSLLRRVLASGAVLDAALEDLRLATEADLRRWEVIRPVGAIPL